jgi:hypothetical protein
MAPVRLTGSRAIGWVVTGLLVDWAAAPAVNEGETKERSSKVVFRGDSLVAFLNLSGL